VDVRAARPVPPRLGARVQVVGAVGWGNARLEVPADVDPGICDLIHRCWRDPEDRPSFGDIIAVLKVPRALVCLSACLPATAALAYQSIQTGCGVCVCVCLSGWLADAYLSACWVSSVALGACWCPQDMCLALGPAPTAGAGGSPALPPSTRTPSPALSRDGGSSRRCQSACPASGHVCWRCILSVWPVPAPGALGER
jgi:hypothetical protein